MPLALAKHLQRHFQSRSKDTRSLGTILQDQSRASERVAVVVRIAYAFPAFWMTTRLFAGPSLVAVQHPLWLWPVAWLDWFEGELVRRTLLLACVATSWLASVCCAQRWARIASAVALFEFLGLCFSLGKIHHLMHGWLFVLASFVMLPQGWHLPQALGRGDRVRVLLTYGLAQTLFALTYALSGVGKLLGCVYQASRFEVTSLHPEALSRHVAARLLETGDVSLVGSWVILHGAWLWPLVLAIFYLQVFALHFAARPRLHRLLAFGLTGFHLSSALILFIDFTPAIVLAGILFGASATAPQAASRRDVVLDLPLFGRWAQPWLARLGSLQTRNAKRARKPAVQR